MCLKRTLKIINLIKNKLVLIVPLTNLSVKFVDAELFKFYRILNQIQNQIQKLGAEFKNL